jgi:glycosyltransferase involved in cell wall biosynthesis
MRLSLLTTGLPPHVMGGMETHSLNMTIQLARLGVDLDVYHATPSQKSGVNDQLAQQLPSNVSLLRFDTPRQRRYPGHYVSEARELSSAFLKSYLQGPMADVIYAKGLMATSFITARRKQGKSLPPIVTNVHGYESFQPAATVIEALKSSILRPAFRYVINHSDFVVSYGGRITELLQEQLHVNPSRIIELPGAVDDEFVDAPLSSTSSQTRRFAFVGRYERRKGLEELAQVLREDAAGSHEFHLIGPIPNPIVTQFPDTVTFHGRVSDRTELIGLLDSIDVLVCPSWSEGMPNVIMEAMTRRSAVIATDVGATRLLVNDDNGRLIPPRKPDALADTICELAKVSDEELSEMKEESRRRIIDRFTWSALGPQSVEILNAVVEHEGSRSQTTAA